MAGIMATATAHSDPRDSGEVTLLASVKSLIGYSDQRTLDAAIFQLIYALDGRMAEDEFAKIPNHST